MSSFVKRLFLLVWKKKALKKEIDVRLSGSAVNEQICLGEYCVDPTQDMCP